MNRLRVFAVACCLLAVSVLFVRAQDTPDLKAVLRKAIEAHGGEKLLDKYQGATSKFKGTMQLLGNEVAVTGTSSFQKPDKLRITMSMDLNGKNIDITQVFDGKNFWVAAMGKTMEITDEKVIKELKESMQTEAANSFSSFLDKPYELSPIGEVKVKGKDAVGIRVSKKGQRDFSMFFDKKTHLLVKTETRAYDPMSAEEVTQEKFFVSYQEKQGMKVAKRIEIQKDGKAFMDIEVTDAQAVEKLDDAMFAKP
jgi:outer membrane lipoprotein-sorting protein